MNKSQLAELYAKKDWPIDEFAALPAFAALEAEPDAIQAIEGFRLPEITKLICCSDQLMQHPWAMQYAHVRPLYQNASQIDTPYLLENHPEPKEFENKILEYADLRILRTLIRAFDQFKSERKKLQTEKQAINRRLAKLESASTSPEEYAEAFSSHQNQLDSLVERIATIATFLKKWKKHHVLIQTAIEKNNEEAVELRRTMAYDAVFPSAAAEEVFLQQFIRGDVLTEEMRHQLQSELFCTNMLRCLDHASYQDLAMPIVMRLYEQGVIDLEVPHMVDYFLEHTSLVSDYLSSKLFDLLNNETSDDQVLLDVVLHIESTYYGEACPAKFSMLWNTITEPSLWLGILQFAYGLNLLDVNDTVCAFLKGLEGDAGDALIDALFDPLTQDMHIDPVEVICSALHNQAPPSPALIAAAFQKMEQFCRSAQRKLRTADRKMNGQAQAIFRSVYSPIEQLEIITSNLRMSKRDIPCQLISSELVDIVANLRTGMLQMNLSPVCDIDEWRKGYPVPFNPETHRAPLNMAEPSDKVILQTMGFRYMGDNGEWQQYNAQVISKASHSSHDQLRTFVYPSQKSREPLKNPRRKTAPYTASISKKAVTKRSPARTTSSSTTPKRKQGKGHKGGSTR